MSENENGFGLPVNDIFPTQPSELVRELVTRTLIASASKSWWMRGHR
jgi:hypothetical protein